MLLKTIEKFGQGKTVFIGQGNESERGAVGHLSSLKEGAKDTTGFDNLFKVSNHMSTDGENKNVGAHKDRWKLIDYQRKNLNIEISMTKSVCVVHSSFLCFNDLCKTVGGVDVLIKTMSGLPTYFHTSAARTAELEKIGKDNDLKICHLSKLFEVRWVIA